MVVDLQCCDQGLKPRVQLSSRDLELLCPIHTVRQTRQVSAVCVVSGGVKLSLETVWQSLNR